MTRARKAGIGVPPGFFVASLEHPKGDFTSGYQISTEECSLQVYFALDPAMLVQILRDFEALTRKSE